MYYQLKLLRHIVKRSPNFAPRAIQRMDKDKNPANVVSALQTFLSQQPTPFEVYMKLNNESTYMITRNSIKHCLHVYVPATVENIRCEIQKLLFTHATNNLHLRIYAYHHHFPRIIPKFTSYVKTLFEESHTPPNFHIEFIHHPEYNCSFALSAT